MRRSSNPSDVVVRVEGDALFTVLSADQLQTVVVNKDCGGATLTSVSLHGLLDRINRQGTVIPISKTFKMSELLLSERTWYPSGSPCRRASRWSHEAN